MLVTVSQTKMPAIASLESPHLQMGCIDSQRVRAVSAIGVALLLTQSTQDSVGFSVRLQHTDTHRVSPLFTQAVFPGRDASTKGGFLSICTNESIIIKLGHLPLHRIDCKYF